MKSEVTHQKQQFIDFLRSQYPDYHFYLKSRFSFRYPKMINLDQSALIDDTPFADFALQTLHELGHALNEHQNYDTAIDRLKLESEAWQTAKSLIEKHQHFKNIEYLNYDPEYAEAHLDTYRSILSLSVKNVLSHVFKMTTVTGIARIVITYFEQFPII